MPWAKHTAASRSRASEVKIVVVLIVLATLRGTPDRNAATPKLEYSFERWRAITNSSSPPRAGDQPQIGRRNLVSLVEGVTSSEWESRRQKILQAVLDFIGPFPADPPDLRSTVLHAERLADHIRQLVVYSGEEGELIPAYLLIPLGVTSPRPAVICQHQTVYQGKEEPAGIRGKPELAHALELVRRGYVTLTPDCICFGDRKSPNSGHYGDAIPFYRRHPDWSIMGKLVWDIGRAIDFLQSQPFVDPVRIGSIGHSHGAYGTLFCAAFDNRIRVAVASCGFTALRSDPTPERWSHLTALIPRIGFYLDRIEDVPFDFHHVVALAAPRPLLIAAALDDRIFPHGESVREVAARVREVYGLLGASEAFDTYLFPGDHNFPPESRDRALAWIDRWIGPAE
jgi:dienelactone hydrolase